MNVQTKVCLFVWLLIGINVRRTDNECLEFRIELYNRI